ncbi:MAG: sensor histidine kinase [Polaribacter sp.]|uniref:sensor histidine kinase n=1 Tax=Polaribacter sp. TaxID=1920175 RepID=UPI003BB20545
MIQNIGFLKIKLKLNYLFFAILFAVNTFSQENSIANFETYFERAKELNKLSLFSKSIIELNKAIELAKKNNLEKEYLESSVFLGEMMRRTADHKKGIEILEKLKNSKNYPKIHAYKLGRMAALYAEGGEYPGRSPEDSIKKYLSTGLKISKENNFYAEEAAMSNELGFSILNSGKFEEAKPYLIRSAKLFKQINDENNYVVVMCHLLKIKTIEKKFIEADAISKELLDLVKNNNWYGTEQTLYRNIAGRYLAEKDSITYYKYVTKEKQAAYQLLNARTNLELSYYRVNLETDKFKSKALTAENDLMINVLNLSKQKQFNQILLLFIIVFTVLTIIVFILYSKKNKIAKSLEISNKKFELLMTESNHRIKNNLQMILSMVDYSSENLDKQQTKTLHKISSKIQTVGVLHKHLYADIHNQFVHIDTYFNEIIYLYTKMNSSNLVIKSNIFPIKIESERIVYFGLILNELLANTLEHNLSEIKNVTIQITEHLNKFRFLYSDNSPHLNSNKINKGGILLNQLVERIKGEDFTVDRDPGTYKFLFKDVE